MKSILLYCFILTNLLLFSRTYSQEKQMNLLGKIVVDNNGKAQLLSNDVSNKLLKNTKMTDASLNSFRNRISTKNSNINMNQDFETLYSKFITNQKTPLLNADKELFYLDGQFWQREYGESEYYLTPSVSDIHEYQKRISAKNDKSKGVVKSNLKLIELESSGVYKQLLAEMNITIPNYISGKVKIKLPVIDIEKLEKNNVQLSYVADYGISKKDYKTASDESHVIWSEGWEGSLAPYGFGDGWEENGTDYWGDVSCDAHTGGWSLWCADEGDQPDCNNYDLTMWAYVYKNNSINLTGYSNVKSSYWIKYDTEFYYDYVQDWYSSGDGNWTYTNEYSGSSNGWIQSPELLLNGFNQFFWEFVFISDGSITNQGVYLDDLQVVGEGNGLPDLDFNNGGMAFGHPYTPSEVWVTVINNGTDVCSESFTGYFLIAEDNSNSYLLFERSTPMLNLGEYYEDYFTINFNDYCPLTVPPGNYYFGFMFDWNNQITESNENNNGLYSWWGLYIYLQVPEINVNPLTLTINQPYSNMKKLYPDTLITEHEKSLIIPPIKEEQIISKFKDEKGKEIYKIIMPGKPPENFRAKSAMVPYSATALTDVPAYDWSFGCTPTSASMLAAYMDRNGYPNIYTGPTNNGVMPLDNSVWGNVLINGESRSLCPLSATREGLDGRTSRGHVDDYWIQYGNNDPDPWLTNGWTQHSYGDCLADYMKTNQWWWGNSDGATSIYCYVDGSPLSAWFDDDGIYGMKLFFENRGYIVEQYYSQLIYGYNGNTLGFTFNNFKQEIDNGYLVLIQVDGHTMLGYGYDDATNTIFLHDTWDYQNHSMVWGGDYYGLYQWGVSVIHVSKESPKTFVVENLGVENLSITSITDDKNWLKTSVDSPFILAPNESQTIQVNIDWDKISGNQDIGYITIQSDDPNEPTTVVTVTANPLESVLNVDPLSKTVKSSSGNAVFNITNTGSGTMNWTAEVIEGADWCSINNGESGTNNGTIKLKYKKNTGPSRTAKIRVTAEGAVGSPIIVELKQVVTPKKYIVTPSNLSPDKGTQISVNAQLVDANGNPVPFENLEIKWSSTNGGTFSSEVTNTDANGLATTNFTVSNNGGTEHIISVKDNSNPKSLVGNSEPIIVNAGTPTQYIVTANNYNPKPGKNVKLTAQLADEAGGGIAIKGKQLTWSSTNGGKFKYSTTETDKSGTSENKLKVSNVPGTMHRVTVTDNSNPPFIGNSNDIIVQISGSGIASGKIVDDEFEIEYVEEIPENFSLMQNYPNPFNPITYINYQLPEAAMVSLVVYDVLGSEVANLVNGVKSAGYYQVMFDGSNLPSGVYFYRLQAGTFSETKKLILMK